MRIALALAVVLVLGGCATIEKLDARVDLETFGEDLDDLCIAGRIKGASARWLNANQDVWKAHPDYTEPRQPDPIKTGDRIFNRDCSEVTKRLGEGDIKGALEALGAVGDGGQ